MHRRAIRRFFGIFLVLFLNAIPVLAQQDSGEPQSSPDSTAVSAGDDIREGRPRSLGSPYVELDSWIYPAVERLAALGYIQTEFAGMRPWTRIECSRLVQEAGDMIDSEESSPQEAKRLHAALEEEFRGELDALAGRGRERTIRLESVYTNVTGISSPPLNDSYHFGQTIINNSGRPYQEGFNSYNGFSGYASLGRFLIYVRGEYQHAPSAPPYSLPVRQVIAKADGNPLQPPAPISTTNQFQLLDTYVAAKVANWNLSFGKQSLWWGPGEGGALLFSDNAEPIYMFRMSRIAPFKFPWILGWLGPVKTEAFFGKLSGNRFPPRPLIHGEKISFKPTKNLEMAFSRTSEFGGVGRPFTLAALVNSYFSFVSSVNYKAYNNPGKRTGGFEFTYRVPLVRDWLTVYADSLSPDDPSPIASPRRSAISPGFYLARIPGLPKLDLRAEAVYTDTPGRNHVAAGDYVYWEQFYHDLYTNKKNIIGSWIGRQGKGYQAWSTYWFSPRNTLQFGYRHAQVVSRFIPGGESLNDGSVKLDWWVLRDLSVSTFVQYEQWRAPLLAPGPQANWTSSVEVTYWPRSWNW